MIPCLAWSWLREKFEFRTVDFMGDSNSFHDFIPVSPLVDPEFKS